MLFNKIYASFCLTGQTGPSGNADIDDMDEGRSEFFRMAWNLNELTTDEAHWIWLTDTGMDEMLHNSYGASAAFSIGLYYRLYFTVTLCNFFLEQIPDDGGRLPCNVRKSVLSVLYSIITSWTCMVTQHLRKKSLLNWQNAIHVPSISIILRKN